jgi:hypothetical protein
MSQAAKRNVDESEEELKEYLTLWVERVTLRAENIKLHHLNSDQARLKESLRKLVEEANQCLDFIDDLENPDQ